MADKTMYRTHSITIKPRPTTLFPISLALKAIYTPISLILYISYLRISTYIYTYTSSMHLISSYILAYVHLHPPLCSSACREHLGPLRPPKLAAVEPPPQHEAQDADHRQAREDADAEAQIATCEASELDSSLLSSSHIYYCYMR